MQELTPDGQRILSDVAHRNGVSFEAVMTLVRALVAGNGYQAQFSHPDLGGMGQWSQGGMIMVGDMFNQGLKYRVDSLCNELANILHGQPLFRQSMGSSQSQSQGNGGVSLFVSGSGSTFSNWWPSALGNPASTGAQNDLRYACFPDTRRLAIQQGGRVSVYDTGDHWITGFSQQQSGDQSLTFTSQFGLVRVADLPQVNLNEPQRQAEPANTFVMPEPQPAAMAVPSPPSVMPTPVSMDAPQFRGMDPAPSGGALDIFATIERLAELRQKGILTEDEFATKKAELLSRL